jgi:hypothetical protein
MRLHAAVMMVLISYSLEGCGEPEAPLMARCHATMAHGDLHESSLVRFEACMAQSDYHPRPECQDFLNRTDPTGLKESAINEPDCWFYANSNMP